MHLLLKNVYTKLNWTEIVTKYSLLVTPQLDRLTIDYKLETGLGEGANDVFYIMFPDILQL